MVEAKEPNLAKNVLGEPLVSCSNKPMTGFFRDGCCNTCAEDMGMHTICSQVDATFLQFSQSRGNDLSTPRPEFEFPGLKPGNRWCLCLPRWLEALKAGCAPPVYLDGTHSSVLQYVQLDVLKQYAVQDN